MIINDTHLYAASFMQPASKLAFLEAIIAYTADGTEPDGLPDEIMPTWVLVKKDIDNCKASTDAKSAAGRKSAEQKRNRASTESQQTGNSDSTEVQQNPNRASTDGQQNANSVTTDSQQTVNRSQLNEKEKIKLKGKPLEREKEKEREKEFDPPTLEEVQAYIDCNLGHVVPKPDAQTFLDHYAAQGWIRGNGIPIRDWQAALRLWAGNEGRFGRRKPDGGDFDVFYGDD